MHNYIQHTNTRDRMSEFQRVYQRELDRRRYVQDILFTVETYLKHITWPEWVPPPPKPTCQEIATGMSDAEMEKNDVFVQTDKLSDNETKQLASKPKKKVVDIQENASEKAQNSGSLPSKKKVSKNKQRESSHDKEADSSKGVTQSTNVESEKPKMKNTTVKKKQKKNSDIQKTTEEIHHVKEPVTTDKTDQISETPNYSSQVPPPRAFSSITSDTESENEIIPQPKQRKRPPAINKKQNEQVINESKSSDTELDSDDPSMQDLMQRKSLSKKSLSVEPQDRVQTEENLSKKYIQEPSKKVPKKRVKSSDTNTLKKKAKKDSGGSEGKQVAENAEEKSVSSTSNVEKPKKPRAKKAGVEKQAPKKKSDLDSSIPNHKESNTAHKDISTTDNSNHGEDRDVDLEITRPNSAEKENLIEKPVNPPKKKHKLKLSFGNTADDEPLSFLKKQSALPIEDTTPEVAASTESETLDTSNSPKKSGSLIARMGIFKSAGGMSSMASKRQKLIMRKPLGLESITDILEGN